MPVVSIVIPALNEESTIGRILEEIRGVSAHLSRYEIETIIAAEGSTDGTVKIAEGLGAICIPGEKRRGKGHALNLGFQKAKGDIIVMMDGDLSHRPDSLPDLLAAVERGADFVVASRASGGSDEYNVVRHFGNYILTLVFRVLFRHSLSDALNGYKCFRRRLLETGPLRSEGFEIEIELLARAIAMGMPITEVPSKERARAGGRMKSNAVRDGFRFLFKILRLGLKFRFQS